MKKDRLSHVFQTKRHLRSYIDTEPPIKRNRPTGPFQLSFPASEGDLLIFVPRNEIGKAISSFTGRYGYSHLAIDCGEIDAPTNRRIMIEATMGSGVHRAFQDEYGQRPYVRIPLRTVGADVRQFCNCIREKIGEQFDDLEVVTLGILDNPARQICSDLATVCLPEAMREKVMQYHKRAVLHPLSVVRDKMPIEHIRLFISPNGFAEFLGAPRGSEIERPDQLVEPHIQDDDTTQIGLRIWKLVDAFITRMWNMGT
jgi:hypothetical protein